MKKYYDKIDIENNLGINKSLARKYNAIKSFLAKNNNVVLENGCLNHLISNIEYVRYDTGRIFETEDYIIIHLDNKKSYSFNNFKELKIDRKYKTIEYIRAY